MSTTLFVGQTLPLSIAFLDQNRKLMDVVPDQAPAWATSAIERDTLIPSADGHVALFNAVVVGDEAVSLALVVGGKTYQASLDVTIAAAPQILTSIEIVAGTAS